MNIRILIFVIVLFICTGGYAQIGDTTKIKVPENSVLEGNAPESNQSLNGSLQMPPITLPKNLTAPPIKSYYFYQDLMWPVPQEKIKPHDVKINFATKPPPSLDNPLKVALIIVGTVIGMVNHQVIGVDKELEIRTIETTFSRSGVPASAREGRPTDNK